MALTTSIAEPVGEQTTAILTGTITDPVTGDGFKPTTLTLTLYSVEDGAIINSRNAVDVLDANGGSVTVGGQLSMTLAPNDNVIVAPRTGKATETHHALFRWTWSGGTKAGYHVFEFRVEDQSQVG